jgi:7-cyano-7-deazaguanine synthase
MNAVLSQNRKIKVNLVAPFSELSKIDELHILQELDGSVELTYLTLTCYNPNAKGESCGRCPSCSERIANFAKIGIKDPIAYSKPIPWSEILNV